MQTLLQGPRQTFRLPVADFKQAVLDDQNGINYPGKTSTGLKIRLPISKVGLAGASSKKTKPAAPRNKSAGSARLVPLCLGVVQSVNLILLPPTLQSKLCTSHSSVYHFYQCVVWLCSHLALPMPCLSVW